MCTLSTSGSCQDDEGFQCGGGQYPCLPHWKFDDNLQYAIGTGAAPDGDADALQINRSRSEGQTVGVFQKLGVFRSRGCLGRHVVRRVVPGAYHGTLLAARGRVSHRICLYRYSDVYATVNIC